jgi:hypothetical protein
MSSETQNKPARRIGARAPYVLAAVMAIALLALVVPLVLAARRRAS